MPEDLHGALPVPTDPGALGTGKDAEVDLPGRELDDEGLARDVDQLGGIELRRVDVQPSAGEAREGEHRVDQGEQMLLAAQDAIHGVTLTVGQRPAESHLQEL